MDIDHGGGFTSQYGHMDSYTVSTGEQVIKGQVVGTMGTKTYMVTSTGVHLHFQAKINGKAVDPQSKFGLECNARAKSSTIYGHLCAPGNQNQEPRGALAGFGEA
jgi:murein DD-endopeptidase MepM/ murein hydrolase activator NlpD